ncbi:MAG: universal stress protein [Myxococcales bacterium]|nr:universal stress protein [Myxococcales bacterium]MDH3482803.1 universal stress protein [Myxococcales bacterium]
MAAKHILVGVDFSEQSRRTVEAVCEYAKANQSKITLIYVTDPRAFVPPQAVLLPEPTAPTEETHKAELDELRDELLAGLDARTIVVKDHAPARAICNYAKDNDVDLIAIGSHGYGRVELWLIGSVAERVVRHAHCSVVVVRQ